MIQTLPRDQVKGPSYSHQGSNLCDLHVYLRSLRLSMWKLSVPLVRSPLFDERSWAGGTLKSLVLVSCLFLTHLSKRLDRPLFPTFLIYKWEPFIGGNFQLRGLCSLTASRYSQQLFLLFVLFPFVGAIFSKSSMTQTQVRYNARRERTQHVGKRSLDINVGRNLLRSFVAMLDVHVAQYWHMLRRVEIGQTFHPTSAIISFVLAIDEACRNIRLHDSCNNVRLARAH